VGQRFKSSDVPVAVEVRWVDLADGYCALVFNVANHFEEETVFAPDFFDHWTLVEARIASVAA
jgi:hypothetical protein